VLVAETNTPPNSDTAPRLQDIITARVMRRMGADVPNPNRITLLRDAEAAASPQPNQRF